MGHPFLVPKWPIVKALSDFQWAKMGCHSLKTGQKLFFGQRTSSRSRPIFCPHWTPGTILGPPLGAQACCLQGPNEHWYRGLGVHLGSSKGWKPQTKQTNVEGCGGWGALEIAF